MASIGNLKLVDHIASLDAGGAFLLKTQTKVDYSTKLASGNDVAIIAGSPYAAIRFSGTSNATETFATAFEAMYEGLNTVAASGTAFLEVVRAFDHCILWW